MAKEVRVLNRVVRWTESGWEYEADQRHGEIIVRDTGTDDAKPVMTPVAEEKENDDDGDVLEGGEARWYRGVAARGIYLSLDRPDTAFASKEASKQMSKPRRTDERRVKRLGRYLKGFPRVVQKFPWQDGGLGVRVYTDADWGGCKTTRKNTFGGVVMRGGHCIKFWSKTQSAITLSTAEAELTALVKVTCEAKGIANVMKDMTGDDGGKVCVYTDASAAMGMVQRHGTGKTRHIDVGMLWIQQNVKHGEVKVEKVATKLNPADVFTKAVPAEVMWKHMEYMGFESREGRADAAVELVRN